jgi:thiamine biosynthesis lipoprotein
MLKRRAFLNLSGARPAPTKGYWQHISRTAMACRFEITLPLSNANGVRVATAALDAVATLEAQLTIFREDSEVSFINQHAAERAIPVESSLFALLQFSQHLAQETGGAFDITSGTLSQCWGFLRREGRIPTPDEIAAALALTGSDKLLFDEEARTIRFTQSSVKINLGSIGKGYALDCIAKWYPLGNALLSAGSSSFLALGRGVGTDWTVGVRHPEHKTRRLAIVHLRDAALSTSGGEEQFFEYEGQRYGHIIDPRSGWPAERVTTVSVIAPSAALTDALATAFYVGGKELAEAYCATHPDVLVLLLERGAARPILIGQSHHCEVEIIHE